MSWLWDYLLLAVGAALFALVTFTWAALSLPLLLVLRARIGRRVGRVGQWLGAWRLDLSALDGLAHAGPLILAPNHPCLLDAVFLVSRLPNAVCVMKGSLAGSFLLGPASRLARYVRNDSLLRLATRAGEELRLGGQLVIFPAGTRTPRGALGPLTEAVGALSRRTKVPVRAIVIEADSHFLGKGWPALARGSAVEAPESSIIEDAPHLRG